MKSKPLKSKQLHSLHQYKEANHCQNKSYFFQLQIEELVKELELECTHRRHDEKLNSFMDSVEKAIKTMKDYQEISWASIQMKCSELKVGFPIPERITKLDENKRDIGPSSQIYKATRPEIIEKDNRNATSVAMYIQFPKACISDKDHLNYRIWKKLGIYCVLIYEAIIQQIPDCDITFRHWKNIEYITYLELKPKAKQEILFNIYITLPVDAFPTNRLSPLKNSLRPHHLFSNSSTDHGALNYEVVIPSNHYNQNILRWMKDFHYRQGFMDMIKDDCVQKCLLLGKRWLRLRPFINTVFDEYLWSIITVYIKKRSNEQKNSRQLFKDVLEFIISFSSEHPVTLSENISTEKDFDLKALKVNFDYLFMNESGVLNLFADICTNDWAEVRRQAQESLYYLNYEFDEEAFDELFIRKKDPSLVYDSMVIITVEYNEYLISTMQRDVIDYGDWKFALKEYIIRILEKALTDRIFNIHLIEMNPIKENKVRFILGLRYNPNKAFRIIDKGPSATETVDAKEFREFWGTEKSELRQFKNSEIIEAVLWSANSVFERYGIIQDIVDHILRRHLKHAFQELQFIGGLEFYPLLRPASHEGMIWFDNLNKAYEKFSSILKGLESPLQIKSLHPISASFRNTTLHYMKDASCPSPVEVFQNTRRAHARVQKVKNKRKHKENLDDIPGSVIPVHAVLLTLETSNQWRIDSLTVMQAMISAYFLALSKQIQRKALSTGSSEKSEEEEIWSFVNDTNPSYLDVHLNGYTFRVYLNLEDILPSYVVTTEFNESLDLYSMVSKESHQGLIFYSFKRALEHAAFIKPYTISYPNVYPATVRLLSLWLSVHLKSNLLAHELIELLVSKVFMPFSKPRANQDVEKEGFFMMEDDTDTGVPGSPYLSFVKALALLKEYHFGMNPLSLVSPFTAAFNTEAERFRVIDEKGKCLKELGSYFDWQNEILLNFKKFRTSQHHPDWRDDHKAGRVSDIGSLKKVIFIITPSNSFSDYPFSQIILPEMESIRKLSGLCLKVLYGQLREASNPLSIWKSNFMTTLDICLFMSVEDSLRELRSQIYCYMFPTMDNDGGTEKTDSSREKRYHSLACLYLQGVHPLQSVISYIRIQYGSVFHYYVTDSSICTKSMQIGLCWKPESQVRRYYEKTIIKQDDKASRVIELDTIQREILSHLLISLEGIIQKVVQK